MKQLSWNIILIVMMIYRPAGLIPAERRKRELKGEEEGNGETQNNDSEGATHGAT